MLSDRTIRKLIANGQLALTPPPPDQAFQPASVDLLLGPHFSYREQNGDYKTLTLETGQTFPLRPDGCVLAHSTEYVRLPRDVVARVEGKSSWGRRFLMVHSTAGFIDPGFEGQITLELKNMSHYSIKLPVGSPIAQISFDWMDGPCDRPYGHPDLASKYQGQTGATPPRA